MENVTSVVSQSEELTSKYLTFPAQITQLVFLKGTWHKMLSPIMKKPVPPHHLQSTCPFESQEHETGMGCCINEHEDFRYGKEHSTLAVQYLKQTIMTSERIRKRSDT